MKTKILLIVSLVLLAVQGWATTVDGPTNNDSIPIDSTKWIPDYLSFDASVFSDPLGGEGYMIRQDETYQEIYGNTEALDDLTEAIRMVPHLKVSRSNISFDDVTVNDCKTESFTVHATKGAYGNQSYNSLAPDYMSVELDDPWGMFSIDKDYIRCEWPPLLYDGEQVNVTYKPTAAGCHTAKVIIHKGWGWFGSDGTKTINISGTAIERHFTATGSTSFNLAVGESDSTLIHVKGTNLNGPLTVDLNDKTGMYSINKESITADEAARGIDVMVIYHPTSVGTHGADVTISGGGALEAIVLIMSGHCEFPTPTITVDTTDLDFGTVILGQESHRNIEVKCSNLNGYLILETHDPCYTVIPDRISPQEAAIGKKVTVTYKPTAAGTHNDFVGISCGISGGPIVNLTGKCVANPTITVSPLTWDFGTVNVGEESIPKTFTVTGANLIEGISIISQLESSGVEFTVLPESESLPATGGSVTITYKPLYEGAASQDFILSSCGVSSTITVSGTGVIPPTIKPGATSLDFGTVYKGKTKPVKFTVRGVNLTGDLTLSSSRPWFTVSPTTITAADAAVGKEVTVTYVPTVGGDHNAILTISGGEAEAKTINLTGKCASVEITPSTHDFGTVKAGTESSPKTFIVKGTNLTERITLTSTYDPGFTVTPTDLPESGGTVTVTFKPTSGGDYSQVFTYRSGQTSGTISVSGKCAAITTSKSALSFGTARKGETKTQKFTVTGVNLTHDLTLTSSNSTLFQVSPTTITAAQAKAGKEVTVTYAPTVCKDHSGTITISGQDITNKTVSLSGKCANITVSPTSYDFGTKTKGQTYTKTFTVTGTNLSQRISIVSTYDGFTVSPTDLPASGGTVTVTFKPTSAGSSYSQEFTCSSDLSTKFSVSGKCGVPSISVNPTSLKFTTASSSKTFKVTGSYLTGTLTLTSSGAPFSVSPKTITASQAASGVTVTVQCNAPVSLGQATGKITISGGGASAKTVNLSYDASGNEPAAVNSVQLGSEGGDGNEEFTNGGLLEMMSGSTTGVNELAMNSKIYAEGQNIIIESPVEQSAVISDIAGHVWNVDLQKGRNEIPVNASGIYIVRIREKTTKLMLK